MSTQTKTRRITVCNKTFDRRNCPYVIFPVIQLCGKWLLDSGFKAGHTVDTAAKPARSSSPGRRCSALM